MIPPNHSVISSCVIPIGISSRIAFATARSLLGFVSTGLAVTPDAGDRQELVPVRGVDHVVGAFAVPQERAFLPFASFPRIFVRTRRLAALPWDSFMMNMMCLSFRFCQIMTLFTLTGKDAWAAGLCQASPLIEAGNRPPLPVAGETVMKRKKTRRSVHFPIPAGIRRRGTRFLFE